MRKTEMNAYQGESLAVGEALRLDEGRRFRCGNFRDVAIVYFLQVLSTRRSKVEAPLDWSQLNFHSQALPHLGLIEGKSGALRCNCRIIHSAVALYCRKSEEGTLQEHERSFTIDPANLTKDWLDSIVSVVKSWRPMRSASRVV